jgi:hypothetical protein
MPISFPSLGIAPQYINVLRVFLHFTQPHLHTLQVHIEWLMPFLPPSTRQMTNPSWLAYGSKNTPPPFIFLYLCL